MLFYPDASKVEITKVVLHYGNTSTTVNTTATTKNTTTSKTTAKTTSTTKATSATKGSSVAPTLYGDVNLDGRVDITDAVLLNKAVAGAVKLAEQQYANADVCTDDGVGSADAIVLLKFLVTLVTSLPANN